MPHPRYAVCAVYILTTQRNTALYIGVTADLVKRLWEHRSHSDPTSFTCRYNITKLVHYETTPSIAVAIAREKQLKGWTRSKKLELIAAGNPKWADLAEELLAL